MLEKLPTDRKITENAFLFARRGCNSPHVEILRVEQEDSDSDTVEREVGLFLE